MCSRTSGDPAEGALFQYMRWGPGHGYLNIYVRTYCTGALIERATYTLLHGTLACFQTFGHGVLNIVHVLLCHMRGAVFHNEVSSWHCSVLIELYNEGE